MVPGKTLIVVAGPTAIGKTALAIQLAKFFSTEIISADSRQFFREMEIGTAKPSKEELAEVKHYFINSHSISTLFSTGDFEVEALTLIQELFTKKDLLIMVGGSGLYLDAVCKGLDELPQTDLTIRKQLNEQFEREGITHIREQLRIRDPEYFNKTDQSNPQRMIRGLEFFLSTGSRLSSFHTKQVKERPFNIVKIALNTDRNKLYERINTRVDLMMQAGLLEEVRSLQPYQHLNALKTVGYSELFDYLEDKTTLASAVDKIKQNTRRFAKRQLTWFRRDDATKWFEPEQLPEIIEYIRQSVKSFKPGL
ncbi:tRNA (adenosine(37)-N6)-dimethylallyltransferase MiaA [Pedobacter sp. JY14-1]|uniref:tRNA (adenosine(37)-N6)-dimethylallyltransferase MiaA n=1 Tax=Pedobacter sp. JY14-1 TaxID=3034151 RepID=UPI0023E19CC1|nr:tRNA (adenosine(37)-N6)-dimethylallyltransferase MiaA [Pedobacter sp. JY14-1]